MDTNVELHKTPKNGMELHYHKKSNTHTLSISTPIKQTNFLTEARQLLNKGVYRAVKFIVKQIQDIGFDLKEKELKKETLYMNIPRETIMKWYPDYHAHRELKAAANWLNRTVVEYETENKGWVKATLVGAVEYDPEKGLDIWITPPVIPLYNIGENGNYTLLDFSAAMSIQNKYSAFFYDKCCKWRRAAVFSYTPEELCKALNVQCPASKLRSRYIIPAEEELARLFLDGTIDFYFESFYIKSSIGQGSAVTDFVFRIYDSLPDSMKAFVENANRKESIIKLIKALAPSIYSEGISLQLDELSRSELFDLEKDMEALKKKTYAGKINDIRSYLWMLLRNRYNIVPTGNHRLKKNPNNEYPKYKKICPDIKSTTQDDIKTASQDFAQTKCKEDEPDWMQYWRSSAEYVCNNLTNEGQNLKDGEALMISSLFYEGKKIIPEYDGKDLIIHFELSIYNSYIAKPFMPLYNDFSSMIKIAVRTCFPAFNNLYFAVLSGGKEYKYLISQKELL